MAPGRPGYYQTSHGFHLHIHVESCAWTQNKIKKGHAIPHIIKRFTFSRQMPLSKDTFSCTYYKISLHDNRVIVAFLGIIFTQKNSSCTPISDVKQQSGLQETISKNSVSLCSL